MPGAISTGCCGLTPDPVAVCLDGRGTVRTLVGSSLMCFGCDAAAVVLDGCFGWGGGPDCLIAESSRVIL